jgi:hypothetical protein
MTENKENGKKPKTEQVPEPTVTAPVAGVALPSVEDRVAALEAGFAELKMVVTKLDTLIRAKAEPSVAVPVEPATPGVPVAVTAANEPPKKSEAEQKTEQEPGESPPESNEEPPKKGEPKTDKERFMAHFNIDEEAFQKLYDLLGDELYKLLPERGQKTKEPEGEAKTEQMSVEEIKAKIAELSKQRQELMDKLYPEAELSEEERKNLSSQCDVIDAEISALKEVMAKVIAEGEGKTERVVAAVQPVENEPVTVTLTEQEIYDVVRSRRLFTPALQVNGILALLEQKREEAET